MQEGDAISANGSSYSIERIQLDPPEVAVVWRSPGLSSAETKILRPVPAMPGQATLRPAKPDRESGLLPPGLATNVK
jgi:hypothetical protein